MRPHPSLPVLTATCLIISAISQIAAEPTAPTIYETPAEFFGTGDFDGDSFADIIIVDKISGKYRLGYQSQAGTFNWVDCRPSGVKGISGFTVGKMVTPKLDALAFTAPDANQITIVDASSSTATSKPLLAPFNSALGPNTIAALDISGEGNTPVADLFVASIYNSPDANLATLLRNDAAEFPPISETKLTGPATRANHLSFKTGQPEFLCYLTTEEKGDTFHVENVSSGKPVTIGTVSGLPAGSDYAPGHFRSIPAPEFILYKPGATKITLRAVDEPAAGQFKLADQKEFDLGQSIRRVISIERDKGAQLAVIFGEGEKLSVFNFDGKSAPTLVQAFAATNELFTCVEPSREGFIAFIQPDNTKFSSRYQAYSVSGSTFVPASFGSLPSLADNDNITIPDIHSRILSRLTVTNESEMQIYTNAIPGTAVKFVMVPIRGGEFVMGSSDGEARRKPDEGPQHRVKISPFWMGQCEVSWNEYELFMYPDEEKRGREAAPTDPEAEKLADAVTHPSRPYVEMSFGMGKNGFPAISMTQHGANKYCQWLSAKTGEFYRLPTEAEWEYACRAGTTNAYFFGDDASELIQYAWFEENSDFKYQKIGKKKPNPWGLYDIYGNVAEWVLDQYDPDFYKQCAKDPALSDPWNKATKPYPHAVRGGSWDDEAPLCRSAARRGSDRSWKMQDPQLPKSTWYFTDATFVGFRVVRPLKLPPSEQLQKYWTSGVERD